MAQNAVTEIVSEEYPRVSEFRRFVRVFFSRGLVIFGMVILLLFFVTAAIGPFFAPFDPNENYLDQTLLSPSTSHWLGTDHLGRDTVADRERDQLVAVHVEREAVARRQRDRAERGGNGAGIADTRRDQRSKSAAGGGDPSLVDDRGIRPARDVEIVPAGHEVGVPDVVGGGEEAGGVHHAAGAEQDAVAVDEEDPPVGGQRAHDLGRPLAAGDAVEHDRRARGLIEAHALVGADVERIPVDDRAAARLVDDHRRGALALDGRGAADHRPASGLGRGRARAEREQRPSYYEPPLRERRLRERQMAQAWMHRTPCYSRAVRMKKNRVFLRGPV